jgi:hypothetical protein
MTTDKVMVLAQGGGREGEVRFAPWIDNFSKVSYCEATGDNDQVA